MNKTVTYIERKSQPQYYSIEGVFNSIKTEVSKSYKIKTIQVSAVGGSPFTILKNCFRLTSTEKTIYHITGDVHYMALVTRKRTVLTIHDIGSALHGNLIKRFYIRLFWFWFPALFVKHITVISEFTKKELIQMVPFAKNKISVVNNPVSKLYKYTAYEFNERCPTILCFGTKANKNLERIIEAVADIPCTLHIIGALSINQRALLSQFRVGYKNSSNLAQEGIIEAYETSDLLCFPSTYEGFGMPIIEAQAIGRPVLSSNLGAMLEVAKDSACLVDPYDSTAINRGVKELVSNVKYRESLIMKGFENVKRFKLETIAKQYISIYNEV